MRTLPKPSPAPAHHPIRAAAPAAGHGLRASSGQQSTTTAAPSAPPTRTLLCFDFDRTLIDYDAGEFIERAHVEPMWPTSLQPRRLGFLAPSFVFCVSRSSGSCAWVLASAPPPPATWRPSQIA